MTVETNDTACGYFYSPLANDPELADLLTLFVDELPTRLSGMEANWQQADWPGLARAAHQLKGAAGSYGFHALTPALLELEQRARGAEDPGLIRQQLDSVQRLCARVRADKTTD